jgi:hypothetical protein
MYTEKEIYDMLNSGKSAEEITDEFNRYLSAANKKYDANEKKKTEAKKLTTKREAARAVCTAVMNYVAIDNPDTAALMDEAGDLTEEEIDEVMESFDSSLVHINMVTSGINKLRNLFSDHDDDETINRVCSTLGF